jgi:ribosomal protein S6
MPLYEHVYLARQDLSTQQLDALTDQFKNVITSNGGSVAKSEYWGVKSLAYRIKKNRKAHFSLLNIDAPPAAITEVERHAIAGPPVPSCVVDCWGLCESWASLSILWQAQREAGFTEQRVDIHI